jgi:hypothetical protein
VIKRVKKRRRHKSESKGKIADAPPPLSREINGGQHPF